jgi:hypothetical protein
LVDLVAVVSPELSVTAGHHAAAHLKARILTSVPKVREVIVHVVPPRVPELLPDVTNVEIDTELRRMCEGAAPAGCIVGVSSVTHHYLPSDVWWQEEGLTAEVAIVVPAGQTVADVERTSRQLTEALEGSRIGPLKILRLDVRLDVSDGKRVVNLETSHVDMQTMRGT